MRLTVRHITLLQRFVRTADLDRVYDAVGKVFASGAVTRNEVGGIQVLLCSGGSCWRRRNLREADAGNPQAASGDHGCREAVVESGPIGAFTAPHGDPASDAALIQYVSTFVPRMSGENFNPHVSTGVAPKEYLDKMLAEPFDPFTFSPSGAAVYQLGPFGTAAKKLKEWN